MNEFKREVVFRPAYDKREDGYGVHGMDILFLLHGKKATMQFLVFSDMHLPHVTKEFEVKGYYSKPMGADLGYHADEPQYEEHNTMECCYRSGGSCYYDGSTLQGEELFIRFLAEGDSVVWSTLESRYDEWFGGDQ